MRSPPKTIASSQCTSLSQIKSSTLRSGESETKPLTSSDWCQKSWVIAQVLGRGITAYVGYGITKYFVKESATLEENTCKNLNTHMCFLFKYPWKIIRKHLQTNCLSELFSSSTFPIYDAQINEQCERDTAINTSLHGRINFSCFLVWSWFHVGFIFFIYINVYVCQRIRNN